MPKKGEKCTNSRKGIKNEQGYTATRYDWSLGPAKYNHAIFDKLSACVEVSAMIKDKIGQGGYKMCTLDAIKKDMNKNVSDRKMRYKDHLFECGFFYEHLGWEQAYIINELRTVFTNIYLLQIFLYILVCDIQDDVTEQLQMVYCRKVDKNTKEYILEKVENTLELYEEERRVVCLLIAKIKDAEAKGKTEIELSSLEYYTLLSYLIGDENVHIFHSFELLDERKQLEENMESIQQSWDDIRELVETKYKETIDKIFPKIKKGQKKFKWGEEIKPIEANAAHGNMEIEVPRFMRSLLLGLVDQYDKLPITIDVNLWSNGTWKDVKWLYANMVYGKDNNGKKKIYTSINYPRIREIIMPPDKYGIEKETFRAFFSVVTYLRYCHQMDERRNRSDIFDSYITGVGGITYYLALENSMAYRAGSVFVFESMFGMYVMKRELEVIYQAIKEKGLRRSGEIWDIHLSKLLRHIFCVKNSCIRIYIVEEFLAQCIAELVEYEGTGAETAIVDNWIARFDYLNEIGEDLENESRNSKINEERIATSPLLQFYTEVVKTWRLTDDGDGLVERQKIKDFQERLTRIKGLYAAIIEDENDAAILSWMIKVNLGLFDNFRIKVME